MSKYFTLVKVQFLSFFGINKMLHGKRGKAFRGVSGIIAYGLLMCAAIGYAGYTYAKLFSMPVAGQESAVEILPLMLGVASIVSFMFSFFATGNVLYGFKDYDMLSAMPVKNRDIVLSKLTYIYVSDLAFSLLILVPSFIVYAETAVLTAGKVLVMLFLALFAPLMMIALSVFIGAVTSVFSSLFRKKNLVQTVLLLALLIGFMALSFASGYGSVDMAEIFGKIYFLYPLAVKGSNDFLYALLFAALNLAAFALITAFVCVTYKKFNSLITAKRTRKNFRLGEYGGKGVFSALYGRETKRLFSCPMYVINSVVGAALAILLSIMLIVFFGIMKNSAGDTVPTAEEIGVLAKMFAVFSPALFAFTFMLAPTTSCAISIEGSSFWLVKTMPVKMKTLFNVKLAVNFTYYGTAAVVCALSLGIFLQLSFGLVMLGLINALAIAALGGNLGLLVNILLPKMKWENENQVIKQSASVLVTLLCAFAVTALFALCVVYINLPAEWLLAITFAFSFVAASVCYALIMTKGEKILNKKV